MGGCHHPGARTAADDVPECATHWPGIASVATRALTGGFKLAPLVNYPNALLHCSNDVDARGLVLDLTVYRWASMENHCEARCAAAT